MSSVIEHLLRLQLIDARQHEAVLRRARSPVGGHLVQLVAEMGYATEAAIGRALSAELSLPRVDLADTPPEPEALALLDGRTCAERFMLPVALRERGELLFLAMADPTDEDAIGLAGRRTQKRIRPLLAGPSEILRAVRAHYDPSRPRPAPAQELEGLDAGLREPGPLRTDDLTEADLASLDALRTSLDKGTHVMRALIELCIEKRVFTVEDLKKRTPPRR